MTFARAKAAGWGLNEEMSSAQANTMDLNQSRAVDGNAGGSYNPSAPIIIATGGLQAEPAAGDIEFQAEYVDHASYADSRVYPVHDFLIGTRFSVQTTDIALQQTDVTSAGSASKVFVIHPIVGTLAQLHLYLKGSAGHGALPGTMPSMTLVEEVPGVSSTTVIATVYDTAADVAAYEVLHSISATGLSISVSATKLYRLILTGEAGANSQVDLKFYSFVTRMTTTRNYPG
jgi:hypothetical protein